MAEVDTFPYEVNTFQYNVYNLITEYIDEEIDDDQLKIEIHSKYLNVVYYDKERNPIVGFSFDVTPIHQDIIAESRLYQPDIFTNCEYETLSFEDLCTALYKSISYREIIFSATDKYLNPIILQHFAND